MIDSIETDSPALSRAFDELRFAVAALDGEATDLAKSLVGSLEAVVALSRTHAGSEEEVSSEGTLAASALVARAIEALGEHPAVEPLERALVLLGSDEDEAELPEWIGPEGVFEDGYEAIRIAARNLATVSPPRAYELADTTWKWYATVAPACADWAMTGAGWSESDSEAWLERPHPALRDVSPTQHWEAGGWYDVLVLLDGGG